MELTMEQILQEYMDYSDRNTLKSVIAVTEANDSKYLIALTNKLYDKITDKANRVDYSYVSGSRGDITKIPHFDNLKECLDIIRNLVLEYKQPTTNVDVVLSAINNMETRTKMFKKAFAVNSPFPVMIYNSIALAIVDSTSFLIATSIEFMKNPNDDTFQMALDVTGYNRARDYQMFDNLKRFNESCKTKEFDTAMDALMNRTIAKESVDLTMVAARPIDPLNPEDHARIISRIEHPEDHVDDDNDKIAHDTPFLSDDDIRNDVVKVIHDGKEQGVQEGVKSFFKFAGNVVGYVAGKAWMCILNIIIPIVRSITYKFYYQKQKMSDYYELQADLLQMNAENLHYNENLSDEEKKQVYDRQMKEVLKFRRKANDLMVDCTTANKNAEKTSNEEVRKFKAEDLDNTDVDPEAYSLF